jgi:hypothetical protein
MLPSINISRSRGMTPFIPVIAVAIIGLVALVCIEIRRANRSLPFFPHGPGERVDARGHDRIPERRA